MDAMKAGAARLEAATALTLATTPTAANGDGTAFRSAVAAYAGTTGGWQTRVTQGGRAPHASARILTVNDVSLCETASSHTGIQVDSIPVTQNGALRTFGEHGTIFTYRGPTAHDSLRLSCQVPTGGRTMIRTPGARGHIRGRIPTLQPAFRRMSWRSASQVSHRQPPGATFGQHLELCLCNLAVDPASGRPVPHRRRGEHPETAAL